MAHVYKGIYQTFVNDMTFCMTIFSLQFLLYSSSQIGTRNMDVPCVLLEVEYPKIEQLAPDMMTSVLHLIVSRQCLHFLCTHW